MSLVKFKKIDEVFCVVECDYSALNDIAEELTFEIPNKRFHPLVASGQWDGNIRLLNRMTQQMYSGLVEHAAQIARDCGHQVEIDTAFDEAPFSLKEAREFIESLSVPYPPYDFQENAFVHAVQARRALILSPTSSGKSFLMYLVLMYFGEKTLIVAPTIGLIKQLEKEIKGYGYPGSIHKIIKGAEKTTDDLLTISTWKAIYKQPRKWFDRFPVFLGDEVHTFDSKCLKEMMEKTTNTPVKIGVTGSLNGTKTHELVLTGLFGPTHSTISTREMIDRGIASEIDIKVMVFSYPKKDLDTLPDNHSYQDEVNFIINHPVRNKFIKNLAESLPGNVLILFRRVEKHGDILYNLLKDGKKKVYYIHGSVDADVREQIRQLAETNDDIIIIASDGTTSTGISINNIQWMIKSQPLKAVINNKQSIGRGLRKDGKENKIGYFDLADDLSKPKKKGYLMKHLVDRLRLYVIEQFPYKIYKIRLENK